MRFLITSMLLVFLASCSADKNVETELYLKLKKEFKKEKIDLKKELNKLEALFSAQGCSQG
ncbi:MAG: hypothetical protein HRT57_14255 [Crocinitomicaceae bacterium]|nr:hypothetical protein [Crocinitomicaceae bacterium]